MVAARAGAPSASRWPLQLWSAKYGRVCPGRWWTVARNWEACSWALRRQRRRPGHGQQPSTRTSGGSGDGLGNDDECGRGCADAHAGGIVAIVAGLAMVASQGASPKFPDCLLAVGYLSVVVFIILTAIGAVWNWIVGLFS